MKKNRTKKPAARNRLIEEPSLNNLNHVFEMYEESGSDVDYLEDVLKGENKKNLKEDNCTDMDEEKEGKQANLLRLKITRYDHDIPRKKGENEKALVTKEMELSHLGKNIFIGDSAATSHRTSNKMGVYNLVPIKGSVMIGNGKSISCTHKRKLDVICKHKDGSIARETWDVKIVPELNHDLFSFTKAMKDGWQMNGRWKEGGLMIELFKTTRARMKFDRMLPSGSSWLMGTRVQRIFDQAHAAMEPGKTIFISKEIEDDQSESDGNNTETQKKLGIDISMIGARKETLGKTTSETKALSSPRNESMERADLTMEDWIQETCLISAVTSGPTQNLSGGMALPN